MIITEEGEQRMKYMEAEMEVIAFATEDVITTSGEACWREGLCALELPEV